MGEYVDPGFSYDEWISTQAETISAACNRLAMSGLFTAAVYAFESRGATAGFLTVETTQPAGACEVIRFNGHGSNVLAVPHSALRSQLWHACRRIPIVPIVTR